MRPEASTPDVLARGVVGVTPFLFVISVLGWEPGP